MATMRRDLESAAPGIYLVRCKHPSKPQPDDDVLEGPLPDKTEADQLDAKHRAQQWQLKTGWPVELVLVVGL